MSLVVDDSGNVGIGTTSPDNKLHVSGGGILLDNGQDLRSLNKDKDQGTILVLDSSDLLSLHNAWGNITIGPKNVVIGTMEPVEGYKLTVQGKALAVNGIFEDSDARFKTNVAPVANVLDKLDDIRPVSFEWNQLHESLSGPAEGRRVGLVAQEVEAVFPELVTASGPEGYRAINYGRLAAVLVEAVRELKAENDELKQRTAALETAINDN